mmetsp:Transcript_4296/g.13892  ORF Transcript_4296/g.13892 Transcript_4296/m.13892 type:complete len:358 (-) Transcript_4296:302-1375(-)
MHPVQQLAEGQPLFLCPCRELCLLGPLSGDHRRQLALLLVGARPRPLGLRRHGTSQHLAPRLRLPQLELQPADGLLQRSPTLGERLGRDVPGERLRARGPGTAAGAPGTTVVGAPARGGAAGCRLVALALRRLRGVVAGARLLQALPEVRHGGGPNLRQHLVPHQLRQLGAPHGDGGLARGATPDPTRSPRAACGGAPPDGNNGARNPHLATCELPPASTPCGVAAGGRRGVRNRWERSRCTVHRVCSPPHWCREPIGDFCSAATTRTVWRDVNPTWWKGGTMTVKSRRECTQSAEELTHSQQTRQHAGWDGDLDARAAVRNRAGRCNRRDVELDVENHEPTPLRLEVRKSDLLKRL